MRLIILTTCTKMNEKKDVHNNSNNTNNKQKRKIAQTTLDIIKIFLLRIISSMQNTKKKNETNE